MAGNDSSLAERQKETWRSRGENTTREGWSCCSKLWLNYQADGCRPGPGWGGSSGWKGRRLEGSPAVLAHRDRYCPLHSAVSGRRC